MKHLLDIGDIIIDHHTYRRENKIDIGYVLNIFNDGEYDTVRIKWSRFPHQVHILQDVVIDITKKIYKLIKVKK